MTLVLSKKVCINNIDEKIKDLNTDNLFLIANFGQYNHISNLIKDLKISNCALVVLYTSSNFYIPQSIHDSIDEGIFSLVYFLEIPRSPNRIDIDLALEIRSKYLKLINILQPSKLYLSSFQFHYSIIATIAKNKGIKVILVEEGLGTYRLGGLPNEGMIGKISIEKVREVSSKTVSRNQLFKKLYKNYKETKLLIKEVRSFFRIIYKTPEFQGEILRLIPNKELKSIMKPFLDFDESYTSFPEVSKRIFNVKDSKFYFSHNNIKQEEISYCNNIIGKYNINHDDYIYLSQQYRINDTEYVKIVSNLLLNISKNEDSKIFIKMHPRNERLEVIEGFKLLETESLGRIKVIDESDFRIENIIKQANVKGVIGITSTALVYTSVIAPKCKVYSIANVLVGELNPIKNINGIKTIKEHTKIINQFDGINFL